MSDLINRKDAIAYFFRPYSNEEVYSNVDIEEALNALPAAEPKTKCIIQIKIDRNDIEDLVNEKINEMSKTETGKWINRGDAVYPWFINSKCDQCGYYGNKTWAYCPNFRKIII